MTAPHVDPGLLAAFLDGTATPEEREDVLRLLAGSREAYAEFTEAAAIQGDVHGDVGAIDAPTAAPISDVGPKSGPAAHSMKSTVWRNRFRLLVPATMLAAAVTIVLASRALWRPTVSAITLAQTMSVEGASGSGSLTRELGAAWDNPGWTVTRGAEAQLSSTARAFRAGVRFSQLEVAVSARDTLAVSGTARELRMLLRDVTGSGAVSAQLDVIAEQHAFEKPQTRAALADQIRELMAEVAWFDLGLWTETAQIAARSGQVPFFQSGGDAMTALSRILSASENSSSPARAAAVRPLHELLQSGVRDAAAMDGARSALARVARDAGT